MSLANKFARIFYIICCNTTNIKKMKKSNKNIKHYIYKMQLNISIDDSELQSMYKAKCTLSTDSGFDLFIQKNQLIPARKTTMIDLGVRCEPKFEGGYYLYPRSSLSKTPLRLANSVGIIDNGYRGTLRCMVDNISDEDYSVVKGDRLFQICHPSLLPMTVSVVDSVNTNTVRGEGGFGSTGK